MSQTTKDEKKMEKALKEYLDPHICGINRDNRRLIMSGAHKDYQSPSLYSVKNHSKYNDEMLENIFEYNFPKNQRSRQQFIKKWVPRNFMKNIDIIIKNKDSYTIIKGQFFKMNEKNIYLKILD